MTLDMLAGIIVGTLIGVAISVAASKRRRKEQLKEYTKNVDLTEEQRRVVEKFLRTPLPSKYDGIGKVLADDVLERQGLKPKWPKGPEIRDEADVRPNPNIVAPPYGVVEEK